MTVAAKPPSASYVEDGTTTAFAVPFRFKAASDLIVDRYYGDGTGQILLLDVDYTVVGGETDAGGTLTRMIATTGATLRIRRRTAQIQPMIYTTGDRFPAVSHEQALDRGTLIDQEQQVALDDVDARSLKAVPGQTLAPIDKTAFAGRYLAAGADGELVPASGTGADAGLRTDLAINAGPIGGVAPERSAAVHSPFRLDDAHQFGARLTRYGFVGDGLTDDTAAWRDAVAEAGERRLRQIVVPAGVSLVTGAIVDAQNPLPRGLAVVGEAALDSQFATQSRLRYVGTETCWSISYPVGGPASTGRWSWSDLTFECADPAGTMFDFGDALTHVASDDPAVDPYQYLKPIDFRRIMAFGARGNGDFLRACKVLHLNIDRQSEIYSFRRGIWLNGADNCHIAARLAGNNTNIRIDRNGPFGNNNHIDVHAIEGVDNGQSFGGELAYSIIDNGYQTTIGRGTLFEGTGLHAHVYLGGFGTQWHAPQFGQSAPMFELGGAAREIALHSPRCTVINPANAPLIAPPADPNIASTQTDYRMRIYDAPQSIQAVLPPHPRLLLFDRERNPTRNASDTTTPLRLDATGVEELSHICTAYNYWGVQGEPGGAGIKEMVADPVSGRWVIHLGNDPAQQGMALNFVVGVDIQPRIYRLLNRMRLMTGTSSIGWALIAQVNGVLFSNAFNLPTSTSYATIADPLDLSAVAIGSTVSINLYNASAAATLSDLYVDAIGLIPVADGGWTAGTGIANRGAFAAYGGQAVGAAYSQGQVQAIDDALKALAQRVLAHEQALARGFVIG